VPAPSLADSLGGFVRSRVAEGFMGRDEIIDYAIEAMSDEFDAPPEELKVAVEQATDTALASHLVDQAAWPTPTDCDRLEEAFAKLESMGIVVRQNFACCSSCGRAEIWDEIDSEARSRDVTGYTFFHQQDTERVAETGSLFLAFGSVSRDEEAAVGVGNLIVESLVAAGLGPAWNGNPATRIELASLDWRRRR
jgi:hypothetical protein